MAVRLPDIQKRAERDKREETGPDLRFPLSLNGEARAPEKLQRSFAAQHGENHIVGNASFLVLGIFQYHGIRFDAHDVGAERQTHGAGRLVASHVRTGGGRHALRDRSFDCYGRCRTFQQHLQLFDVLRLGPRKFFLPVGKGHVGAAGRQGDGGFQGRVASAHHKRVFPVEVFGVVQPVVNLIEIFAGATQLAVVPTAPDGHNHAPRPRDGFAVPVV